MKLLDLRLRGSSFTLGTIVNDTDHDNFRALLFYLQKNATDETEVPDNFSFSDIDNSTELAEWSTREGYCTQSGDVFTFTPKAFDVFNKVIKIDNELSAAGFHCCPCKMF